MSIPLGLIAALLLATIAGLAWCFRQPPAGPSQAASPCWMNEDEETFWKRIEDADKR